jgi:hypothetical protein
MAGRLSNGEIESIKLEHGGKEPPYYYVTNIRRIYDDRVNPPKEYITFNIMFEGLCVGKRDGVVNAEPNMRINASSTIGYHILPRIRWENLKDEDGEEKCVALYSSINNPIIDGISNRVYELPFSKELVEELMKHTKDRAVGLGITQTKSKNTMESQTYKNF